MSSTSTLVLLLGGLVLLGGGFAAGYVVGGGGGEGAVAVAPIERPGGGSGGAPPVRVEPSTPRLESTRAVELESLRSALASLPPPAVPVGAGTITGRVTTETGEPVAGVTIRALPDMPEAMREALRPEEDAEPDLPSMVKGYVDSVRWRELAKVETLTDDDGRYVLNGLFDVANRLTAEKEGWQIRPRDRGAYRSKPGGTVDFQAEPRTAVRVEIYLPDGTQPEVAQVSFGGGGRNMGLSWRSREPVLDVEPGTYEVTATSGTSGEYKSEAVALTLERGGPTPTIRLDLAGRPMIRGRIRYPEGQAMEQAMVRLARVPKGKAADPALLTSSTDSMPVHVFPGREVQPHFQFQDLVPGRYLVGVARGWQGAVVGMQEVTVDRGPVDVTLQVPALEREEYVILRLRGPDGKPLGDAQLSAGHRSEASSFSTGANVIRRPDGELWVMHPSSGGSVDKGGRNWISATHPAYGTKQVEYEPGTAPALELRFEEPGTLEVAISGLAGSAYDGRVQVGLQTAGEDRPLYVSHQTTRPDADGNLRLTGIQPGDYRIALTLSNERFGMSPIESKDVAIASGANRLRLAMPALYEVTFEGLVSNAWIQREGERHRPFHRSLVPTEDGRAVVDGLPAGSYVVRCGAKESKFALPGATTVRVE